MALLSVVVPLYNHDHTLAVTLEALSGQTLDPAEYEILFVDDASRDRTLEQVTAWRCPAPVRILKNPSNMGRSRTRNRGWREARGDAVLFIDGDVVASPDLFATMLAHVDRGGVDVVSGRRWCLDFSASDPTLGYREGLARAAGVPETVLDVRGTGYEQLRKVARLGQLPNPVQEQIERELPTVCADYPSALTRALALITSNVVITRSALEAAGGFERFLPRGEDTELGLKLAEAGARFSYAPEASIIHPFFRHDALAPPLNETFQALFLRYPYRAVIAFYLFALRTFSQASRRTTILDSLVAIARAETRGELQTLDLEALARESEWLVIPARSTSSVADLASFLGEKNGVSAPEIDAHLRAADERGVLANRHGGQTFFDLNVAQTWLADQTPLRQRSYLRSFYRTHWTPRQRGDREACGVRTRWTGRYEVTFPRALAEAAPGLVRLNLALPVEGEAQRGVRLTGWEPPELEQHIREGMVFAFPVEQLGAAELLRAGFDFSCEVREILRGRPQDPSVPIDRAAWMVPDCSEDARARLSALLLEILNDTRGATSTDRRARAIYDFMLGTLRYRAAPLPMAATAYTGLGHCITLSRLFVTLCRLAAVPAREQSGALVEWDEGDGRASIVDVYSPFAHTWAEFYSDEETRFCPVEFLPSSHGTRVMTPVNFPDPALARAFASEGTLYDAYYFGQLDASRLYGSPHASRLPTLAVRRARSWEALDDASLRVRHTISLRHEDA